MGRDPSTFYQNELDLLNSLVHILKGDMKEKNWNLEGLWSAMDKLKKAKGILPYVKHGSSCTFKIKTVKICFILEDGMKVHKNIDWEAL